MTHQFNINIPDLVTAHILDHLYDDIPALRNASTVSHSWRRGAIFHLFSELKVTAYDGNAAYAPHAVTQRRFEDCLDELKSCIGILEYVKLLVLEGPTCRLSAQGEAEGVRYSAPDVDICIVRQYLALFPRVHSLHMENTFWNDCFPVPEHDCFALLQPRPFRSITLSRITHFSEDTHVLDLLRCTSSLDHLGLQYIHRLPVDLVVVPRTVPWVSLHRTTSPRRFSFRQLLPDTGNDTIVGLNYREVGDGEIRNLGELLSAHRGSMEHIGLHMENEFNGA